MFCKKCGSQIPDNSAFCPECGAAVSAAQAEQPSNAPMAPAAKPAMDKKRLTGIIAVGAAALVVIIILVAILAGGGKGWEKVLKKEMKCARTGDSEPLAELIPDKMYEAIADYYDVDAEELKEYFIDEYLSDVSMLGDDYTFLKYEVTKEKDCSSSDLKDIKEYLKERGISSKDDVKEAIVVKVKIYFKDEDGDRDDTKGEFTFVKIEGKWYDYEMIESVCFAAFNMSW
ncbi:MAG: zinc-ribbon domain-containing protein [Clostridiales bacterium]|nr:zinc-ribbon domain-containing protein [Clostridiales bacterium]MDY5702685.1 zinc-ribbon domain-containing protein [Eubacteriales bacterium]